MPHDQVSLTVHRELEAFAEHQHPKRYAVNRRHEYDHEDLHGPPVRKIDQVSSDENPHVPQQRQAQILNDAEEPFWRLLK